MGVKAKENVKNVRSRTTNHPNPTHKKGDRNLFCSHYCQCLDFAIKKSWDYWACPDCRFKNDQQYLNDYPCTNSETVLYYTLSPDIFLKVG
jgi:hypothetical protein